MRRFWIWTGWMIMTLGLWGQPPWPQDSATVYAWTDSILRLVEQDPRPAYGVQLHAWQREAGVGPGPVPFRLAYALGEFYQLRARPDSGIYWYQRALDLGEAIWPRHLALTDALNGQAICYFQKGDFDQALPLARQVLDQRRALLPADHSDIAQAHNNYGIMAYRGGQVDSCLFHMARATEIWENDPHTLLGDLLAAYNNLGIITGNQGDYRQGLTWYQKILRHQDSIPPNGAAHVLTLAGVYNNLAVAYRMLGDYAQAIRYLRQSLDLEIEHPSPDPRTLAIKYDNLGTLFLASGQPDSALACYQRADAQARAQLAPDDLLRIETKSQLARIYLHLEQYESARQTLLAILPLAREKYRPPHRHLATLYQMLGQVALAQGDTVAAQAHLSQALRMRAALLPPGHDLRKLAQLEMANAHWHRQPAAAEAYLQAALQPGPAGLTPVDLEVSQRWGQWLAHRGAGPASQAAYREALARLDTLRRSYQLQGSSSRLLQQARPLQSAALQALLRDPSPAALAEAWAISEGSRALRLRETLQALAADAFGQLPEELYQAEQDLRARLTRLERRVARAQERAPEKLVALRQQRFALLDQQDSLLRQLQQAAPSYYRLRYAEPDHDPLAVQQWLAQHDRDLVEYFIHEGQGWALVMRPDTLLAVALSLPPDLPGQVEALRAALYQAGQPAEDAAAFAREARRLYQQVWAPVQAAVPDLRRQVIVVPDGPLGYLPFGLLLRDSVAQAQWATLPYLLREVEVSYAPAAQWLVAAPPAAEVAALPLLALAPAFVGEAPSLRSEPQAALLHNRREAQAIARLLGGQVWLDEQASEAALKQKGGRYRILHFASHAAVDDRYPLYSYVQLTPGGPQEDGRLEIADLFGLRLNADLVVLSACETGMGEYVAGEGILSLAQGFSYAGARSALTTWWPVNDEASAQLMQGFYQNLKNGQSRPAALRNAQLQLLQSGDPLLAHPFFWAGYQFSGDPAPLQVEEKVWHWGWILGLLGLAGLIAVAMRSRKQRG